MYIRAGGLIYGVGEGVLTGFYGINPLNVLCTLNLRPVSRGKILLDNDAEIVKQKKVVTKMRMTESVTLID